MQVVLVMFRADGERRSFSVVRDVTVLGRREDCDLRIPLGDISRKHCRIIRNGDSVRIEDLGSSNGTLCNGERITSVELQPGDTVAVGPVTFVVQINGVPGDDELAPYAHNQPPQVAQDTAVAAAAVGVGTMTEVEPPVLPEDELVEAEELEEDFGAAPLVASVDDDDDAVAALDPLADSEASGELQPAETLEEIEELEEVEDLEPIEDLQPVAGEPEEAAPQPIEDLAHLDELPEDEAPTRPPAPAAKNGHPHAAVAPPSAPSRAAAAKPEPKPEPDVIEPVEGELQQSDVFEGLSGSSFEVVVDDASENSASGEIEIDWNTESKT